MSILGSVYYLPLPPINSQWWRKLEESESWLSCNLSQPSPPFVSVIPTSRMLNIIPYIPQLPITILYKSRGGWIFWGWTRLLRREHTVNQLTEKGNAKAKRRLSEKRSMIVGGWVGQHWQAPAQHCCHSSDFLVGCCTQLLTSMDWSTLYNTALENIFDLFCRSITVHDAAVV